jgi:hypothetical protein
MLDRWRCTAGEVMGRPRAGDILSRSSAPTAAPAESGLEHRRGHQTEATGVIRGSSVLHVGEGEAHRVARPLNR